MKKFVTVVLALAMVAAMAAPAYAANYLEVKAQTQAKVGADSDTSLEAPVKAQVQAGDCVQECDAEYAEECDGSQVQFQFGQSEDKPVGYKYAGERVSGAGAGHHFSHKHAFKTGTVEEAAE